VTLPGTGGTVSFKYDPFGRRIEKSSSAATSVFAYDGDNLIEETNSSGAAVARYSQGQDVDEPLAMLRSSATLWKASVLTSGGKRAYVLSFEPEYGPKNEIIGLDLVLVDAKKGQGLSDSNLLNPQNWHGMQPYDFLGKDLAQGPDKSSFGSRRELKLDGRKLLVRIDISSARVSPLPHGDYEIDQLELAITVDNLSS
jgi:hypothetical protein